jgi:hypothetical protein
LCWPSGVPAATAPPAAESCSDSGEASKGGYSSGTGGKGEASKSGKASKGGYSSGTGGKGDASKSGKASEGGYSSGTGGKGDASKSGKASEGGYGSGTGGKGDASKSGKASEGGYSSGTGGKGEARGAFPQTAVVRAHLSTVLTLATSSRQRRSEDRQDKAEQSLVELQRRSEDFQDQDQTEQPLTLTTSARQRRSEDRQDQTDKSLVELRRVLMVLVQLVPPSDVASNPVLAAALESHLATPLADASSLQTPSNTITAGGENAEESK